MSRPTDNDRLWAELASAARLGVHSFDIRAQMHIGNPSQRVAELEELHDCSIPRQREKRNGRMGMRYFHPDHGPADTGGKRVACPAEPSAPAGPSPIRSAGAMMGGPTVSTPTSADAGAPDREPEAEAEQLGLIDRGPSIYDAAA